jgi:hypothetical protein
MKASTISILVFVIFNCPSVQAQTIDTLIDTPYKYFCRNIFTR